MLAVQSQSHTGHAAPVPVPAPVPVAVAVSVPAPAEEPLSITEIKRHLHVLYKKHCPEKSSKKKINALVAMFQGREMHLLRQVQAKYSVKPQQPMQSMQSMRISQTALQQ